MGKIAHARAASKPASTKEQIVSWTLALKEEVDFAMSHFQIWQLRQI
jgi:hypothetical protein